MTVGVEGELNPGEREFLDHYNFVVSLVTADVEDEEFQQFHDALSAMLNQANRWGQLKAAKELRDWADEFGPKSAGFRRLIHEGADHIEKEAGYGEQEGSSPPSDVL